MREIRRNSKNGVYSPEAASAANKERRGRRSSKIARNIVLQERIINNLSYGWSPGAIAGRLKYEGANITVCAETIYQFIYNKNSQELGLYRFFTRKHQKRQLKYYRRTRHGKIPDRVSIEQRPTVINQRLEIGHMETDLLFCQGNQSENILTSVDCKSRYVVLSKNISKDAMQVTIEFVKAMKRENIPIKSSTFDNGLEFARHAWMRIVLGIQTFFCKPYSPWQKGQIENTNGRLRYFIPKRANIRTFSEERIRQIQDIINNQPRKCLGYRTPREVLYEEIKKLNGGYCCV